MKPKPIFLAYAKSLAWTAAFAAVLAITVNTIMIVFIDFIHGNPNRSLLNAIAMIPIFSILFAFIAAITTFLVFTLSHAFQAIAAALLIERWKRPGQIVLLVLLPLTIIISFYSYDYLTPTNITFLAGAEWLPYEHGLTLDRFRTMALFQIPVTLFGAAYCDTEITQQRKARLLITAFALTVGAGIGIGYYYALGQYRYL